MFQQNKKVNQKEKCEVQETSQSKGKCKVNLRVTAFHQIQITKIQYGAGTMWNPEGRSLERECI